VSFVGSPDRPSHFQIPVRLFNYLAASEPSLELSMGRRSKRETSGLNRRLAVRPISAGRWFSVLEYSSTCITPEKMMQPCCSQKRHHAGITLVSPELVLFPTNSTRAEATICLGRVGRT
jgi:hypothetical protein